MYRRTRCSVKHKLGAGYSVGNLEIKSRRSITSYNFTTQSPPLSRALSETQLKARFIVVGYLENRRFLFLVLVFSHRYTFLWIRGYNNPFLIVLLFQLFFLYVLMMDFTNVTRRCIRFQTTLIYFWLLDLESWVVDGRWWVHL